LRHYLGWVEGTNARFELRQSAGDVAGLKEIAKELVALKPDVIVVNSTPATTALARQTSTLPIVFINVADPVGIRLIARIERPGGNLTGIVGFQTEIAAKWVETLKVARPGLTRIAVMFNPATNAETWQGYMSAARLAAASSAIDILETPVDSPADIERTLAGFADQTNIGLIVVPLTFAFANRQLIATAAAQSKVPAIYGISPMVRSGGLLSLGPDVPAQWGMAAVHVDRLLRGGKPGEIPVQVSTKLALAINLKAAKALGLTLPRTLLARADEVIE
jgi:putative tryptophan/tyrosine transport system substrate-binding protein